MAHIKFDDMDAVTEHFQKKEDADKVAAGLPGADVRSGKG